MTKLSVNGIQEVMAKKDQVSKEHQVLEIMKGNDLEAKPSVWMIL